MVNYRVNMIRKFYYVMKIDGVDVTNEEREIAIMDQTVQPVIPIVEQMQHSNIYMTKMENTKRIQTKREIKLLGKTSFLYFENFLNEIEVGGGRGGDR